MTMFDAGASVKHHHARRNLVAVAIGLGALIGSAGVASARPPLRDWVPQPQPKPAAFTDWRQAAELLPVSMVHERNAMLGNPEEARLIFVAPGPDVDSGTRSIIAKAKAVQAQVRVEDRPDTKDHPLYPGSPNYTADRPDTKDHPRYGSSTKHQPVVTPIFRS